MSEYNKHKDALSRVLFDFESGIAEGRVLLTWRFDIENIEILVDKETPRKPSILTDHQGDFVQANCKNCDLILRYKQERCDRALCGQVVDWSEHE